MQPLRRCRRLRWCQSWPSASSGEDEGLLTPLSCSTTLKEEPSYSSFTDLFAKESSKSSFTEALSRSVFSSWTRHACEQTSMVARLLRYTSELRFWDRPQRVYSLYRLGQLQQQSLEFVPQRLHSNHKLLRASAGPQ